MVSVRQQPILPDPSTTRADFGIGPCLFESPVFICWEATSIQVSRCGIGVEGREYSGGAVALHIH